MKRCGTVESGPTNCTLREKAEERVGRRRQEDLSEDRGGRQIKLEKEKLGKE
jgi:hypothetical protein